ncbi:MAG TPA: hypothetical protein VJ063_17335 [Verrucomicrobiae bacterium]|nr:hypothetical protein [Verrucomicrobiae bacterium]
MSIPRLAAVFLVGLAAAAQAQISVELLVDQEQFLRDENLPVKVRIVNRSGQTVKFGAEMDWLSFNVETREGKVVQSSGDLPAGEAFSLESSMVATRLVDISSAYRFELPGRYSVSAVVKVKEWGDEFPSKAKPFEIVRGTKLWEQEFGIPSEGGAPEVRKYILQQAQYQKRLMLYLRVTDPGERFTYRCQPVGPLVSFSRPEAQVDRASNLHLLFQAGARSFRYAVYTPSAELLVRQYHEYGRSRPGLRMNEAGGIFVNGGARRILADDVPPPAMASNSTNDVAIPKP